MVADKLFDDLAKLSYSEKLRVMQWLANNLVAENAQSDDDDVVDVKADFREAWHSAMTGEGVRDIEELWAEMDAEEAEEKLKEVPINKNL